MKKVFKFLCVVALLAINALGAEVNVYAAANTTYAFPELIKEFNKLHPDAKINLTLGASGGLVTQIQNSAPADIFMAADMGFAQKLCSGCSKGLCTRRCGDLFYKRCGF